MTTVIATSDFIIADKRANKIHSLKDSSIFDKPSLNHNFDFVTKIDIGDYFKTIKTEQGNVVAVGFSGTIESFEKIKDFIKVSKPTNLSIINSLFSFFNYKTSLDLLFLTENGGRYKLDLCGNPEPIRFLGKDSQFLITGSGSKFSNPKLKDLFKNKKITIEEAFLYVAYQDPYSSVDYSVYSRRENHLYRTVSLKESEYLEKIQKVDKLMHERFFVTKKKFLFLCCL